jgi:hypothetical protein
MKTEPDKELAQRICDFLNELLELDRPAIAALINNRVPCNQAMADHPTVQIGAEHGGFNVGMLGLLNGLCGVRENLYGLIYAIFDGEQGKFQNLIRFEVNEVNTDEEKIFDAANSESRMPTLSPEKRS